MTSDRVWIGLVSNVLMNICIVFSEFFFFSFVGFLECKIEYEFLSDMSECFY